MSSTSRIWGECQESTDFVSYEHKNNDAHYFIGFFKTLVDPKALNDHILDCVTKNPEASLNDLYHLIPLAEKEISHESNHVKNKLLQGFVAIQQGLDANVCLLAEAALFKGRDVSTPEIEFTVEGPKEAFVESLGINLYLIRKRIPYPEFRVKELVVGSISKSKIAICYIEGLTNEEYLHTVRQRIEDIQFDQLSDITLLQQMIEDNSNSVFPQTIGTERPDYATWAISSGQVCVLLDGSPIALFAPVTLGSFFISYEDYYLPWIVGSIVRLTRMLSVVFSIFATPLYVAMITYHGHGISNIYLPTLISSRISVPFPPVVEVLTMELVIELLREAGARLPNKIGQTIGIVGGIVLGTAAVEASITSNFLLIIVALSALASFTTPIYRMSATIRILRFPFIISAQLWGILGIAICGFAVITHLLRLTSLGMPYLVPFYPFRPSDLYDSVIRAPYTNFNRRFSFFRSTNPIRFDKHKKARKDIDE
ncbi:spore germination protein [Paenibacillus glycinis]|uniref:Spore germination protein n=1 Tax=Paenibacillus glycinis TaxID=2697035 RepID=A0ABW9XQQ2_9BACL|nr:spore germination protein [Paenibacillus glycinis]NBD24982.1 spore germination protein [Paenibacillus glycinis]